MKKSHKFLFAALTGILLSLAFPPFPFGLLAFVAFIPLLFMIEKDDKGLMKYLYLTFWIYHGASNWWISSFQEQTDPFLMAAGFAVWLGHPFFFMIPIYIYRYFRRNLPRIYALLSFPFIWTALEWSHSQSELSYPWLSIGYSQLSNLLWVQTADVWGVFGLGFFIAMVNVLILELILRYRESEEKISILTLLKSNKKVLAALLAILVLPNVYGYFRVQEFEHTKLLKENRSIEIGVIQPSINPWQKWASGVMSQIELHQHISDSLKKAHNGLDLVIWSETAIPFLDFSFNQGHEMGFLQEWSHKQNFSLISGFVNYKIYMQGETPLSTSRKFPDGDVYYDNYNSAVLLNPVDTASKPQFYNKMKLTPFAERLPHAEVFKFAIDWFVWGVGISYWGKGAEQHNMILKKNGSEDINIGTIICIESIYPDFVRNFANQGAEVLTIITNDAWYDYTYGPEQHYQIGAMRAIESRRYIARCANTGVSGFITPIGTSLSRANQYKSEGIAATVPLLKHSSIFQKYGDMPSMAIFFGVLISFLVLMFKKK